eukprot:53966-Rhodomonas_salina.1
MVTQGDAVHEVQVQLFIAKCLKQLVLLLDVDARTFAERADLALEMLQLLEKSRREATILIVEHNPLHLGVGWMRPAIM